jgi:hypothetical protein
VNTVSWVVPSGNPDLCFFAQFFGFSDPATIAMIRALPGYEILQGLAESLPGSVSVKA